MKQTILWAVAVAALPLTASMAQPVVRTGQGAFGDFKTDAPGVWRHISAADLPAPFATASSSNGPKLVKRPDSAEVRTLPGFTVSVFASNLQGPRRMRLAPNGDVFLAESEGGRITILRARPGSAAVEQTSVFADGLKQPYGIAFYPQTDPKWVYVANTDSVVRYPYRAGDLKASGPAEVVIPKLPSGGHWTRDLAFSPDGSKLFISVGSGSNVAESMPKKAPDDVKAWEAQYGLGAAWANETLRADVLVADAEGKGLRPYATGIRNCAGLSVNDRNGDLWCTTNERDLLGDNLAPDYSTRVRPGQFYGWPWYYIGDHEDPRLAGQRPDLKGHVATPDVLYQSHSAPLQLVFYGAGEGAAAFPKSYDGEAFATLHGSWNRSSRTGYKVVRLRLKNGVPTGDYEDFMLGFVTADGNVWGRPVGLVEAQDGALLVSDDGGNVVWRVAYAGRPVASN
jgi:glucose/arabinose dehydrogenase